MIKKIVVFIFCISLIASTYTAQERFLKIYTALEGKAPSQEKLDRGIKQAVQAKDYPTVKKLLKLGATPPLYTAAATGQRKIATKIATKASKTSLSYDRKKLLKRLILTGDPYVLNSYLKAEIIDHRDIKPEHLKYAQERSRIHRPNKTIALMLEQACIERKSVKKKAIEEQLEEQNECVICLDSLKATQDKRALACMHTFHTSCINPWLQQSTRCPFCRQDAHSNSSSQLKLRVLAQVAQDLERAPFREPLE